jgi:hypothetical protein
VEHAAHPLLPPERVGVDADVLDGRLDEPVAGRREVGPLDQARQGVVREPLALGVVDTAEGVNAELRDVAGKEVDDRANAGLRPVDLP